MASIPIHQMESTLIKSDEDKSLAVVLKAEIIVSEKGRHFCSSAYRQRLVILLNNGSKEVKTIFVKRLPKTQFAKSYVVGNGLVGKEIKTYKEVLIPLENFMRNSSDYTDILWPRFIGNNAYSTIILEDLLCLGYKSVDSTCGLDLPHSIIAFKSLAKFHALSVIFKNAGLLDTYQIDQIHNVNKKGNRNQRLQAKFLSIAQVIKNNLEPRYHKFATDIENSVENILDKLVQLGERDDSAFNVLNHGDFWTSNLMFKYSPFSGKVAGMRFVDFQMCHFNSYAFDIQYLLQTSVQQYVKTEHYHQLLEAYHEALKATFTKYQFIPENLPSLNAVFEEVGSKLFFGVITAIRLLEIMVADDPESLSTEETFGNTSSALTKSMTTQCYSNKLRNIIDPYIELNLFNNKTS